MRIGFDNEKYITMQADRIHQRISEFGGKLYLEFGGKLLDDNHASRILPGFAPDAKAQILPAYVQMKCLLRFPSAQLPIRWLEKQLMLFNYFVAAMRTSHQLFQAMMSLSTTSWVLMYVVSQSLNRDISFTSDF